MELLEPSPFRGDIFIENEHKISCESPRVVCARLNCSLPPFEDFLHYTEVVLDLQVDLDTVYSQAASMEIDNVTFVTEAALSCSGFVQSGDRSDSVKVSNKISLQKRFEIVLWIKIGSVVIGLLVLVCLAICLAKVRSLL